MKKPLSIQIKIEDNQWQDIEVFYDLKDKLNSDWNEGFNNPNKNQPEKEAMDYEKGNARKKKWGRIDASDLQ